LAGIIGPLVLIAATLLSNLDYNGYDWLSQTISQLSLGPYGWIERTGFIITGVSSIIFAEALYAGFRPRRSLTAAVLVWLLIGLGFTTAGVFQADTSVIGVASWHGLIHNIAGYSLAGVFPFACFLMVPVYKADIHWRNFVAYTIAAGTVGLVMDLSRVTVPWSLLGPWNGLYERVILLNALVWLELVALKLLTHTRTSDK